MTIDDQIAQRFVCTKCNSGGAQVKRIATTGTGFSRLMNFQNNHFIAASCRHCGYTEMYDPQVLEGPRGFDLLDALFSG